VIVRPAATTRIALLVLCLAGCGSDDAEMEVVAGFTTDLAVGFDLQRVERTTRVDGSITHTDSLFYGAGNLALPAELLVKPARDGADVAVSIAAFRDGEAEPFLRREAETRAASGRSLFLPVSLDAACSATPCAAGTTCVNGACVDPFLAPSALADYDPTWITSAPDACKTPASGAPAIVIGQGASAFAPLEEGAVVPIEKGPQGGHHVWLALRVNGLRQMGSRLTVEGYYPDLGFKVRPFTSYVTLRKTAESHCEIYGIRDQVDQGIPVEQVRGQTLDIVVVVEDPNGDAATAKARVVIAP
jgi:hypothetical protein